LQSIRRLLPIAAIGLAIRVAIAAGFPVTAAASGDPTQTNYSLGALVIKYIPTADGVNVDQSVTGDVGGTVAAMRTKTDGITTNLTNFLSVGTAYHKYSNSSATPSLTYHVAGTYERDVPVPTVPNPHYDGTTDLYRVRPDYNTVMSSVNVCDWVQNHGVDEVWMYAYQGPTQLGISESEMSGPNGDISNSFRDNPMPVCAKTYTVYTINEGRGTAEAVHSHGHQLEAELNYVDQSTFSNQFEGPAHPGATGQTGRCGSVHNPPNSKLEYDWADTTPNTTDCSNWSPAGGPTTQMSCTTWGCADVSDTNNAQLNWIVFWMQNFPGKGNAVQLNGRQMRNWWDVHANWDSVVRSSRTLTAEGNTVEDDFWRPNQTGLGSTTNSDGVAHQTWANYGDGTHSSVTITNHSAQFTDPGSGSYGIPIWAGDTAYSDGGEALAEVSATYVGTARGGLYLPMNFCPDASCGYEFRLNYNSGRIELARRTGGSTAITASSGFSFTSGQKYWVRFNYNSSTGTLAGRIWSAGTPEPSAWNLTWTDTGSRITADYSGLGNWWAGGGPDTYNVFFFAFSPNASVSAVPATLDSSANPFATEPADGGKYTVDLEEFGSSARLTATTDNHNDFLVTRSSISQTNGSPGAYPSIDTGCHANGSCETGTAFPVQVSSVEQAGTVTTSASTTVPGASGGVNSYDDAYDIFFTSGRQTGWSSPAEMMVWLDNTPDIHPAGTEVAANVSIGGNSYNVWYSGTAPGGVVTYQFASPKHDLNGLDLGPLTADAVTRGYIGSPSWWMEYADLGFEIWKAGAGLAVNSYSICVSGSC
jgi:hypothetical protein